MKRNEYGWRVDANMLYFDPPGVGFSKREGADY
jgi:carboxypeptidase C (cathepsin A)